VWDVQWCGRKKQGTAYHKSKKDRQMHGPDSKESGGRKTLAPYPRRNGGREDGTWDMQGFGNNHEVTYPEAKGLCNCGSDESGVAGGVGSDCH